MTTNHTTNPVQIPATEAADRYLTHRENEVRQQTIQGQATPVNRFARWCDQQDKSLHRLNGLDLQDFYNTLKNDENLRSKATLHNYMTAVRQFLLYLERLDAAPSGIADKVHRPTLEKEERRRDEEIKPDRVKQIVEHLERFHYASRDHVIMLILWRCGLRKGSLYSLDVDHVTKLEDNGPALTPEHRPTEDTPLKNGEDGERPINLTDATYQAIQNYIDHNRTEATDDYGREPLLTSCHGRYSKDQIRKVVHYWTCPETTNIQSCSCNEKPTLETAASCDESVPPHCLRSASITYWRRNDIPVEVVSDRMNATQDIIKQHYDRRTEEGKARQRRQYLDSV